MSDNEVVSEERATALRSFFAPEFVLWELAPGTNLLTVQPGDSVTLVPKLTPQAIVQRLDDVLGLGGWAEEFTCDNGATRCILRVRLTPESDWVTRYGVAPMLTASSLLPSHAEASRVAAMRLGIGRYLTSYTRAVKWLENGSYHTPRLPDDALPDAFRRAGRERAATLRALFNTCVEESGKLNRPVNPEEAARRLVSAFGYAPDSQGNVSFAECEVRHVKQMTEQCNEWLSQLAARNAAAPANPMNKPAPSAAKPATQDAPKPEPAAPPQPAPKPAASNSAAPPVPTANKPAPFVPPTRK